MRLTSEDLDKLARWRRTAETWSKKATALLRGFDDDVREEARFLVGYEASRLLAVLLDQAGTLARLCPLDDADERGEAAERVVAALAARRKNARKLRLAEKLSNVSGRTPEEAKAFLAKAGDLSR